MLTFTLAISCLTTSNLAWSMDLTFQVPMQYCSLQHRTLLLSHHIPNWVLFLLWLRPFILSRVFSALISGSILDTYWPGEFLFQYPIILPFHTVHDGDCSHEEIPHAKGKRNPSKTVGVARRHQRADTLKPYSQKTSQSNHTRTIALSNSVKLSHAHPRWAGHGGEVWQNVVHWRREWQTTSVFLPWEPHEQYEKAKW